MCEEIKREADGERERERTSREAEMKTISAAITKDLGGILSENFFFSSGTVKQLLRKIPQLPVRVRVRGLPVCARTTHKAVGNTN